MTPGTARAAAHAGILEVDRSPPASALAKYAGQPMDFADASVVLLATGVHEILTADRRDFAVHLTSNSTQAPPRFAVMTGAVTTR